MKTHLLFTLLAQASSSQDVSCRTLMISLISALIFSKVKFRFFKASSTPWLLDVLVVTKIFIPEMFHKIQYLHYILKKCLKVLVKNKQKNQQHGIRFFLFVKIKLNNLR